MGRREIPLPEGDDPLLGFASDLRALRASSGLTYDQLRTRTHYSVTTLQNACSGKSLPTLAVTRAMVAACGYSEEEWIRRWQAMKNGIEPVKTSRENTVEAAVGAAPSELRRSRSKRTAVLVASALGATCLVAASAILLLKLGNSSDTLSSRSNVTPAPSAIEVARQVEEQEFHKGGAPSFLDPHDLAGVGPRLAFKQKVMVSCKVFAPSIPSVSPDGYWYRIAGSPWDGRYYAAANTFLNGDNPAGPYTHNTDRVVPDCPN